METIMVELSKIDGNPWNAREREIPEHVQKIAESIKINGLMQAPVGRLVDTRKTIEALVKEVIQ